MNSVAMYATSSLDKSELLEQIVQELGNEFNVFPLSYAQQQFWVLDQLAPHSPRYTIPIAVRLAGLLDLRALHESIAEIIRRHETLRTHIMLVADVPVQVIGADATMRMPLYDLRQLPSDAGAKVAQWLLDAAARRPFDLAGDQLIRSALVRLGETEHLLVLTLHHIIADGWSIGVFMRELATLYAAYVAGQPSPLAALPIQYVDYVAWQRETLRSALLQDQRAYWQNQLRDAPPVLDLPTDRPRSALANGHGAKQPVTLSQPLTQALITLSQRENATLFMTVLAAFQTLLYRYTAQHDLLIGSPIAGRSLRETEPLIGCFVNMLVLRTDLAGNPSFRALLARTRDVALQAYAHQDLPFEQIVAASELTHDASLVQVVFVLQNAPMPDLQLAELALHPIMVDNGTTKFDLTLDLEERAGALLGWFEYDTDLFEPSSIARLNRHFLTLLDGIVADPAQALEQLPLLTAAERAQLLTRWNATAGDYPHDVAVHALFEAQAARTPDAVAVVFKETKDERRKTKDDSAFSLQPSAFSLHLTYATLNTRANQLAHALQAHGVGPDTLVALCLERSPAMLVGILGILKAGGAYVPLDPAYPADRLTFMLDDTQASVIVTDSIDDLRLTIDDLGASDSPIVNRKSKIVNLRADWPRIAQESTANPPARVSGLHRAYVIYTSGSTGRPKGVMVLQRGLVNLVYGLRAFFDDPMVHATGVITSISFDISVNQIFPTLLFGRTLHLIADDVKLNSMALFQYLDDQQLQVLDAVPSYMQAMLNERAPAQLPNALRYLLIGGEPLEQRLLHRIFDQLGATVVVVNIYGLTECSDINAFALITAAERDAPVTIGQPLQNNQLHILNAQGQPQPIGVVGELCISGVGLSRGYLNRPDLTAARFLPNPFAALTPAAAAAPPLPRTGDKRSAEGGLAGGEGGTRLFATGDAGHRRADGRIELLGRLDQQVKLRGFRIELGEIETLLAAQPGVRACAVVVHEDPAGDRRLVAYVVPAETLNAKGKTMNGPEWSSSAFSVQRSAFAGELRDQLHKHLPEYMLPATYVLLDALPTTPNGKLDRRALPAPDWTQTADTAETAPRTPIEAVLVELAAAVLGQERVGIHDNFFALGGHSLRAMQLIARVRQVFQIELPLRQFFEAPTMASLAVAITQAQQAAGGLVAPPLAPVRRDQALPLSFAQERLWFLEQLRPNTATYVIAAAVHFAGQLDAVALSQSITRVVQRHESLRTSFGVVDGRPVQLIAPPLAIRLPCVDLSALPADMREAEARRHADAAAQQPFDLAHAPLVRATLLRLGETEHMLLWSMHHIIADGWSLGVLVREIAAWYDAAVSSPATVPPTLPELPIQYADYASWQREWLQGAVLQHQLDYWQQQLRGSPPSLELPLDRPRPALQTFSGAKLPVALAPALSERLAELSREAGATLFMTLLAAFTVLLQRHTQQTDILVGTPVANRSLAQTEPLIGMFVNTLVLRTDLAGNPSFRALLARVRDVALQAYAHQDLPFEQLVAATELERDLSRSPLFQVMFVLQNAPMPPLALTGVTLRLVEADSWTTQFDLMLDLTETPDGLRGWLRYNTDLLDATTIRRMVRQLETVLTALAADPDQPIATLPLLPAAERQLLTDWNDTLMAFPAGTIHQLFEQHAERTPDATAIVFDFEDKETRRQGDKETTGRTTNDGSAFSLQLSYGELNRRANQLAHALRRRGIGPEALVGVCMERSLELVVALLGVLKAGGAYLPIEPDLPSERRDYLLQETQALLTTTKDEGRRTNDEETQPESLHDLGLTIDVMRASPAAIVNRKSKIVNADNLAYVIYTSGSTGQPKGAMNTHGAIRNRLRWMQDAYALAPADRVMQKTPFSFDVSVWEFFWPLANGAQLVLARPRAHKDSAYLVQTIIEHQITTLHFVPSMLQVFLEQPGVERCSSVQRIICSGEALPFALQQRCQARLDAKLYNLYGPTEAAVDVTAWTCDRVDRPSVPIGRPIANIQIHLLDRQLQPVPIGVVGEVFIGGVGLARGYFNRPDLTAERFVPNSWGSGFRVQGSGVTSSDTRYPTPDTRLYRTGDLARYLPDGAIDYLGRSDHQVKLRGFRIELGEIETVLGQHPSVRECVVVVRADPAGDRLVAYVVPTKDDRRKTNDEDHDPSFVVRPSSFVPELRAFLTARLPDYMIPAAFVLLDALPLTANGKLDRRALPLPETARPALPEAFVAPRSATEEVLAGIWSSVLGLEQLGIYDNFFTLGGHSLLAAQLIARVRDSFQVELPLRSIFETPTIAALAASIDRADGRALQLAAPPILPMPRTGDRAADAATPAEPELTLSFAQQRLWFINQLKPDSAAYNIYAAVELTGALDVGVLARSLNAVVRRHETLRSTFATSAGRPLQRIAPTLTQPLPVLDLCALSEARQQHELTRLATEEARRPFDLARGPLLRTTLLRLATRAVLLLTIDHIIADGWSLSVLVRELTSHYAAFAAGESSPLPALPIQYVDFAHWQQHWLNAALDQHLAYWRSQFSGDLPTLHLPSDQPRSLAQSTQGATQSLTCSAELTKALKLLSRQEHATLFMTLLAAFATLLARQSEQDDIIIGTPIANRNRAETEGLIGILLNMLALRVNLAGNPDFRTLIGRVRTVALDGYTHQDLPFEKLVEELQPERQLNRHPLFDVVLNYRNTPSLALALPGLSLKVLDLAESESNYAMTLYADDHTGELNLRLVYQRNRFAAQRMAELLHQVRYLLEQVAADADRSIWDYGLATPEARAVLPDPRIVLPEPRQQVIVKRFVAWAERAPEHVAVRHGDCDWTYDELAARAHTLAGVLVATGVAPGDVVAVTGARSFGLIVGMLGVLWSGGVLLPLAQDLPPQRHQVMLERAGGQRIVYVGQRRPADDWMHTGGPLTTISVDAGTGQLAEPRPASASGALPELSPDDAAYIFFTSGTTGVPKGVLGIHKGLAHFLDWQRTTFAVGPRDRSAQLIGLSFDVVMRDIFLPLTSGATLCLPASHDHLDPGRLMPWLEHERISLIHSVPSLAHSWLGHTPPGVTLAALRYLFFSGEPLNDTLVLQWRATFSANAIVNLYGTTETSLAKSCYIVPADPPPGVQPGGWPLPETQMLVLAENGQLCGVGEPGQIVIRTPFRSLGYVNAPRETHERFRPNHFRDDPNDLLDYSGDRGRYRADGALDLIGRVDDQVKIRGVRVELSEVEAVINRHPVVHASVVLPWEETPGDKSLVAYIVATKDERRKTNDVEHDPSLVLAECDSSSVLRPSSVIPELRRFVQEHLPSALVPAIFMPIESIPLTPNGKVNRRALPAPARDAAADAATYVAPQSEVEQAIAAIWQTVLRGQKVGLHDNFFDLGGHSLLLVQAHSQLQERFARQIPIAMMFKYPTVQALAAYIRQSESAPEPPQPKQLKADKSRLQQRRGLRQRADKREQGDDGE